MCACVCVLISAFKIFIRVISIIFISEQLQRSTNASLFRRAEQAETCAESCKTIRKKFMCAPAVRACRASINARAIKIKRGVSRSLALFRARWRILRETHEPNRPLIERPRGRKRKSNYSRTRTRIVWLRTRKEKKRKEKKQKGLRKKEVRGKIMGRVFSWTRKFRAAK